MYDVFISPGVRLTDSATARLSGGVAMLLRKQFANVVTRIHVELDNLLFLSSANALWDWQQILY